MTTPTVPTVPGVPANLQALIQSRIDAAKANAASKTDTLAARAAAAAKVSKIPGTPPSNTLPGAGGATPPLNLQQLLDQAIAHLTPDQQALVKGHIGDIIPRIQQAIDSFGQQAFASLDHMHGPDGGMVPSLGAGGAAQFKLPTGTDLLGRFNKLYGPTSATGGNPPTAGQVPTTSGTAPKPTPGGPGTPAPTPKDPNKPWWIA